jgi:hypothetical protein
MRCPKNGTTTRTCVGDGDGFIIDSLSLFLIPRARYTNPTIPFLTRSDDADMSEGSDNEGEVRERAHQLEIRDSLFRFFSFLIQRRRQGKDRMKEKLTFFPLSQNASRNAYSNEKTTTLSGHRPARR